MGSSKTRCFLQARTFGSLGPLATMTGAVVYPVVISVLVSSTTLSNVLGWKTPFPSFSCRWEGMQMRRLSLCATFRENPLFPFCGLLAWNSYKTAETQQPRCGLYEQHVLRTVKQRSPGSQYLLGLAVAGMADLDWLLLH